MCLHSTLFSHISFSLLFQEWYSWINFKGLVIIAWISKRGWKYRVSEPLNLICISFFYWRKKVASDFIGGLLRFRFWSGVDWIELCEEMCKKSQSFIWRLIRFVRSFIVEFLFKESSCVSKTKSCKSLLY